MPELVEMVICAFKAAVKSHKLIIAFKLLEEFDLAFELNQIEVTPFLIQ